MQIMHLNRQATQRNEILQVQIAANAADRLAAAGGDSIPRKMTPADVVSAVACAALGMETLQIGRTISDSRPRQVVSERLVVASKVLGVPVRNRPALVRGAFRFGLLDIEPRDDTPGKRTWPVGAPLTERTSQILDGASLGLSEQEIAQALNISPNTVKFHSRGIQDRLNVHSGALAVTVGHHMGFFVRGALSDERVGIRFATVSPEEK